MNHAKGKGKCRKCVSLDLSLPVLVVQSNPDKMIPA